MAPRKTFKPRPSGKYNEESSQSKSGKTDSFFIKPRKNVSNRHVQKNVEENETSPVDVKPVKKPFDKKAWRLKKYSRKHKIEQWENRRKHAVLQGYRKTMKKDNSIKLDVEKIYQQYETDEEESNNDTTNNPCDMDASEPNQSKRKSVLDENVPNSAEIRAQQIALKEQARKEYKKKKLEKFKKLNQKTKKGQPVMKGRIELLLEEIQQRLNS
ncbi:uncharacterized protein LOC143196500 isoform X2 [Rhynchophorus ferrugineus]|uniref:uncharacterized protein LOC143196500 isoform X2 n=1 Tax=Rhynchophorus ferrugineus TaxID=354439 RepID=UPI003FCCE9C6